MKSSLSLLYFLLFIALTGKAQSPLLWKEIVGNEPNEKILDISVREDNAVLYCGSGSRNVQSYVIYGLIKHNSATNSGSVQSGTWKKESHSMGMNIIPLRDGNVFITGSSDVGTAEQQSYNTQGVYAWVEAGTVISSGSFGANDNDWLNCAQQCRNGDVLAGGKYRLNDKNMILVRFAPDGTIKKEAQYGFNDFESMHHFIEKENGNIVIVGSSGGLRNMNRLIFETDSSLNILWTKVSDNAPQEEINFICLVDGGGYIVAGTSTRQDGRKEAWYALLNERGEVIWEKSITDFSRENKSITVRKQSPGKYAIAFNRYGKIENENLSKNHDLAMLVINDKGETLWEYTYATPELEYFSDMEVNKEGHLLLAGVMLGKDSLYQGVVYCFAPQSSDANVLLYVMDKQTNLPIAEATLTARYEGAGDTIVLTTNSSGGVSVPLRRNDRFTFRIEALGYESLSDVIVLSPEGVKQENKYYLVSAKSGSNFIMKSVIFERGTTTLLADSYAELDKLVQFLKDHPEVKIELSGHTDNGGLPKANQTLSEQRAATVKDYLVSKGIAANRITGKGYGGKKPIAPNNTEENKSKNRRVEVKIL